MTASQALSQLSYAPVRRSTIRELPRRCKDNFGKYFAGGGEGGAARPRTRARERASKSRDAPSRPRGAPRGRRPRRPPLRRPWDISSPADRRFSLPRRGPPSAQRLSRRRRARYRGQPRPRRPGDLKTMPVYGARPGTPKHAGIGKIKTAGRRLANSVK